MVEYVAGFMFEGSRVALIRKNRPRWQEGKLNGIGGHIELGETPEEAKSREFEEETGCRTHPICWGNFATLTGGDYRVYFFYTYGPLYLLETKTDEKIEIVDLEDVNVETCIPNLTWLIPMAKSLSYDKARAFAIQEEL